MPGSGEAFCWSLCLSIIDKTCAEIMRQAAVDVIRESSSSDRFAQSVLVQSFVVSQGNLTETDNRPLLHRNHARDTERHQHVSVVHSDDTPVPLRNTTALQHVRQKVLQTEARTAALERQLVQGTSGTGNAAGPVAPTTRSLVRKQDGHEELDDYMNCLGSLMAHMSTRKHMLQQQGHSQCLQLAWPLCVAPSPEQQASYVAQASRTSANLQAKVSMGGLGQVPVLRLTLPDCVPLQFAAIQAEQLYWQNVSVSSSLPGKCKLMLRPNMQQVEITALQASPNKALLAVGSISGIVTVISTQRNSFQPYLEGDASRQADIAGANARGVVGLTWDASSQYILSMMFTGQICIWRIPTNTTPQTSSTALAQPHAMQLQFISASSIAQIAALAHPYALPHKSVSHSAQAPHTALLQQRIQGSCHLWVPLAAHDILTVCSTAKLLPVDKAETVAAAQPQTAQVYHGHQAQICILGWLQPDSIISVDRQGQILQWSLVSQVCAPGWHLPIKRFILPTHLSLLCPRGFASQMYPPSSPGPSGAPPESEVQGVQPWLVQYSSQPAQPGLLLKQVLHAPNYAEGEDVAKREPLLLSTYNAATQQLLTRHSQPAVKDRCRMEVVGGHLLAGAGAHLLLIIRASTASHQAIVNPLHIFSCHTIRLQSPQKQGPRIDIWDSSKGQRDPVYAVGHTHSAVPEAVLWFSLGSNQLACYSLITGHLVAALAVETLPPQAVMKAMQLVRADRHGYYLAIAIQGSGHISCLQINDAAAMDAVLATTFAAMHVDAPGSATSLRTSSDSEDENTEGSQTDNTSEYTSTSMTDSGLTSSYSLSTSTNFDAA